MEQNVNILLVDDHQLVIDGIKSMLADQQELIVCDTARSGEEAWIKISSAEKHYDVVITDISMTGMSGIELCTKIKTLNCFIKVLVLSMHDEAEYIREALLCESDGYLLKNSGKKELITAIKTMMEKGSYYAYDVLPHIYAEVKADESHSVHKLSPRELEVFQLILQEMTSKEIAEKLYISKQTVDTHRINIMEKTSSKSVVGLIKYAIKHNLL